VQRDVEPAGVGGQRFQPPGRDLGRVARDGQRQSAVPVDLDLPGGDLEGGRGGQPVLPGTGRAAGQRRRRAPMSAPGEGAGRGQPLRAVRAGGVAGGGEQRGELGAVQRPGLQVGAGQQPGGLGGRGAAPSDGPPRTGLSRPCGDLRFDASPRSARSTAATALGSLSSQKSVWLPVTRISVSLLKGRGPRGRSGWESLEFPMRDGVVTQASGSSAVSAPFQSPRLAFGMVLQVRAIPTRRENAT
jgi:hypothetical protein